MEEKIKQLIQTLERVAEKNSDVFRYRIEIETHPRTGAFIFQFIALESADGHEFVSGKGRTLEEAASRASADIDSACDAWGYEKLS
jgi:hypothetical protein